MTANQINAESVRENERHNAAYEAETNRHNLATEEIQREYNQATLDFNRNKLDIDKQLKEIELQITQSQGNKRLELEEMKNNIQQQLVNAEQEYKTQMAAISSKEQESNAQYRDIMGQVSQYNADLQAKRDYYANQKTEAETYNIGYMQKYNSQMLDLSNRQFSFEMSKWYDTLQSVEANRAAMFNANASAALVNAGSNTAGTIFKGVGSFFKPAMPIFGF